MKKHSKKPNKDQEKETYHPFGLFILFVGVACLIGGIYLHLHGGQSTGYHTYKYGPGEVKSLNGAGVIFFGIVFIIIGGSLAKRDKKE